MGIEQEFARFGAKLRNRNWAVSALIDDPKQLVVSLWAHNLQTVDGRWIYNDSLARWQGAGRNLLKEHLSIAHREGLPLRCVVATMLNRDQVLADTAKQPRNVFKARPKWLGRVERLDGDAFFLVFDRLGDANVGVTTAPTSAKYWHVAEAVETLGGATAAEAASWLQTHYPNEPIGDIRANLEHLTVNSRSRPHYDYTRTNWRSDSGHPRDRLFKIEVPSASHRVRFEPFNPARHGHVELRKDGHGRWEAVHLVLDEQAQVDAKGQAEAFSNQPPIDNALDARVWAMRAVHQRRGQPLFRARLLEAYDQRCAISGCTALDVLEAAHIQPYRGEHTNRVDNGLLLRADIHTLFDCLLLWITQDHRVAISPSLLTTEYAALHGRPVRLPISPADRPNAAHLAEHAQRCNNHGNP